ATTPGTSLRSTAPRSAASMPAPAGEFCARTGVDAASMMAMPTPIPTIFRFMQASLLTHRPPVACAPVDLLSTPVATAATGPAISGLNGVRPRMPAAAPTAGRAWRAAAHLFGPPRVHPRTVAALPYRGGTVHPPPMLQKMPRTVQFKLLRLMKR